VPAQSSPIQIEASDFQFRRTLRDRFALLGIALRLERGEESGRHGGFDKGTERCGRAHGEEAEFRRHSKGKIVFWLDLGYLDFFQRRGLCASYYIYWQL
jgi:hypothetical protein